MTSNKSEPQHAMTLFMDYLRRNKVKQLEITISCDNARLHSKSLASSVDQGKVALEVGRRNNRREQKIYNTISPQRSICKEQDKRFLPRPLIAVDVFESETRGDFSKLIPTKDLFRKPRIRRHGERDDYLSLSHYLILQSDFPSPRATPSSEFFAHEDD